MNPIRCILMASLGLAALACSGEATAPLADGAPLRHALVPNVSSIQLMAYRRPPDPPTLKGVVSHSAEVRTVLRSLHRIAEGEALPRCSRPERYDGLVLLDADENEVGRVVMECDARYGELWSDNGEPVKVRIDAEALRVFDGP